MKRKDQIGNAIDELIDFPGKNDSEKENTKEPTNTNDTQKEKELVMVGIKIDKNVKKRLEEHFESKGLNLSTGIRMVMMEYLNENIL